MSGHYLGLFLGYWSYGVFYEEAFEKFRWKIIRSLKVKSGFISAIESFCGRCESKFNGIQRELAHIDLMRLCAFIADFEVLVARRAQAVDCKLSVGDFAKLDELKMKVYNFLTG